MGKRGGKGGELSKRGRGVSCQVPQKKEKKKSLSRKRKEKYAREVVGKQ